MLLGFISLLLTIGTRFIAKICIPAELGSTMLPCKGGYKDGGGYGGDDGDKGGDGRRKLLSYAEEMILRRVLAAQAGGDYCSKSVSHHPLTTTIFITLTPYLRLQFISQERNLKMLREFVKMIPSTWIFWLLG